jgi:hypothetical protein
VSLGQTLKSQQNAPLVSWSVGWEISWCWKVSENPSYTNTTHSSQETK